MNREMVQGRCPLCGAVEGRVFHTRRGVPAQDGVLWATREEALACPMVDTILTFCGRCGAVWNDGYDPDAVRFERYDVATDFSPAFRAWLEQLADRLVRDHHLDGRPVADVGCGRGTLLRLLQECTGAAAIGIDPSEAARGAPPGVRVVNEFFSEEHAGLVHGFLACRHVLDIVPDPMGFLALLRGALVGKPGASLYVEVADARHTLEGTIVWNIIHERRTWFTRATLQWALERCGFVPISVQPCWQDEYLGADARVGMPRTDPPDEVTLAGEWQRAKRFADGADAAARSWQVRLEELEAGGKRVAMWGAGARGVMLLSGLDAPRGWRVVDINPGRQGLFLPRSGLQVEAPETLAADPPEVIVISNPTYAAEIAAQAAALGLHPTFIEP